jgi:hypothetical protein
MPLSGLFGDLDTKSEVVRVRFITRYFNRFAAENFPCPAAAAMPVVTHYTHIKSAWQLGAFVHDPDILHIGIKAVSLLPGHLLDNFYLLQFTQAGVDGCR